MGDACRCPDAAIVFGLTHLACRFLALIKVGLTFESLPLRELQSFKAATVFRLSFMAVCRDL